MTSLSPVGQRLDHWHDIIRYLPGTPFSQIVLNGINWNSH
jgi:hypothetical protein